MPTKTKEARTVPVTVTIAQFDTIDPFEVVRSEPIGEYRSMEWTEFQPRAGTPLRDATARMIAHLDAGARVGEVSIGVLLDRSGSMATVGGRAVADAVNEFVSGLASAPVADPGDEPKVLCVIFTDGEENSSREVAAEALRAMVSERESRGWSFIFLGANIDAWAEGMTLGYSGRITGQTVNFAATPSGMRSASENVMRRSASYLSNDLRTDEGVAAYTAIVDGEGGTQSSIAEDGTTSSKNKGKAR